MIDGKTKYRASDDAVFTLMDDGQAVVLNLQSREYYTLNPTASDIWRFMDEGITLAEIAARFSNAYAIDSAEAFDQIREYLDELVAEGLVVTG